MKLGIYKNYHFFHHNKDNENQLLMNFNLIIDKPKKLVFSEKIDQEISLLFFIELEKPNLDGFYIKITIENENSEIESEKYLYCNDDHIEKYLSVYNKICNQYDNEFLNDVQKLLNNKKKNDNELNEFLMDIHDEDIQEIILKDKNNESHYICDPTELGSVSFLRTGIQFIDNKINSWVRKGEHNLIFGYAKNGRQTSKKLE